MFGDAATLKGGVALERLQQAGRLDLDDFLSFEIEADRYKPDIETDDGVAVTRWRP